MLANLLPGLRQIRAPLLAGGCWVLLLYFFTRPDASTDTSRLAEVARLAQNDFGSAGVAVLTSVTIYVVGVLAIPIHRWIARRVCDLVDRYAPSLLGQPDYGLDFDFVVESEVSSIVQAFEAPDDAVVAEEVNAQFSYKLPQLFQQRLEASAYDEDLMTKAPTLAAEVGRLRSEAEFIDTASLPVAVLVSVGALHAGLPIGVAVSVIFVAVAAAVALLRQGRQRRNAADRVVLAALRDGQIEMYGRPGLTVID